MADKRITALNPLSAAAIEATSDVLAIADTSAGETKKVTPVALLAGSVGQVPDGSIPGGKIENNSITSLQLGPDSVTAVELADNAVDTGSIQAKAVTQEKLADGAVDTDQLADGAITADKIAEGALGEASIPDRSIQAIKIVQNTLTANEIATNAITADELANSAVDTPAIQDGAVTEPKLADGAVTNDKLGSGIDGAKLDDGSVTNAKLAGGITGDKLNDVPLDKLPKAPPNTVLAGSNGGGTGTASFRSLEGADLPVATDSSNGVVNIPAAGGLAVNGSGSLGISNSVASGTNPVVTYNEHGLITAGRPLNNGDLPAPAAGELGAVKAGAGITITGDGTISQSVTGVSTGTFTKVTVDNMGNVVSGGQLESSDLPTIDADQISGGIGTDGLQDKSVTRPKLADYAITYIQEDQPPVGGVHIGCLWLQESTARLSMFNGNSWHPVGQGRLSSENLRYSGIFDATTGNVTGLTKYGTEAGLVMGEAIPAASDDLTGVYLVCEIPGNGTAVVPGESFAAGNWCLCNGADGGWVKINQTGGSGGGGGATRLNDLVDVTITDGKEDDVLQQDASGVYKNVQVLSAGTY